MNRCRVATTLVRFALVITVVACSDGKGDGSARSPLLNFTPDQIAATALSAMPLPEYAAARAQVAGRVRPERVADARTFTLVGARGPALASDPKLAEARRSAAAALGTELDPLKEQDATLAEAALAALLAEVLKINPAATSCESLGAALADSCAIALIIIDVKRSERTAPPPQTLADSGSTPPALSDAGVVADGGSVRDGSVGDAAVSPPTGPVAAIECPPIDLTGAREVTGNVMVDEVWSGKILVKGALLVRAVSFTIMPGTEIVMDVDSSITVGYNGSDATLIADGTAAAPIRFCGKGSDPGYWGGLTIESNVTSNSVLRNVLIAGAGGENEAALDLEAKIAIDNVQVKNAGKDGVRAAGFKAASRALSVSGSGGAALVLTGESALTDLPLGGSFVGNADNRAHVRFQSILASVTLHEIGIPYVQDQTLLVRGGEFTLEPGVQYQVRPDAYLSIGYNGGAAAIHANGTAEKPVVFGSSELPVASWGGLELEANVLSNSNLTYTEIRNAGSSTRAPLELAAAVKIDHVTVTDSGAALVVGAAGIAANSTALTVTKSAVHPLTAHPNALFSLPAGGLYTGNAQDQILVDGSSLEKSGTIANLGVPYALTTTLLVRGPAAVTVAPGTTFLMGAGSSLVIGYNGSAASFIARGTAAAPIQFRGVDAVPGYWSGIDVEAGALSNSALDYVQIGHAGSATGAALTLARAISVTNSRIYAAPGYGIEKDADDPSDYTATNTFEMLGLGPIKPAL